jgi:hypothetical protein
MKSTRNLARPAENVKGALYTGNLQEQSDTNCRKPTTRPAPKRRETIRDRKLLPIGTVNSKDTFLVKPKFQRPGLVFLASTDNILLAKLSRIRITLSTLSYSSGTNPLSGLELLFRNKLASL